MLAADQWNQSQAANPICRHGNIYFRQFFNFQVRWASWPLNFSIQEVFHCQVLFHVVLATVIIQILFLSAASWSIKEQMLLCFCLFTGLSAKDLYWKISSEGLYYLFRLWICSSNCNTWKPCKYWCVCCDSPYQHRKKRNWFLLYTYLLSRQIFKQTKTVYLQQANRERNSWRLLTICSSA